jgi:hypothetical protein
MKTLLTLLLIVLMVGCSPRARFKVVPHEIAIPSTNRYTVVDQARITSNLDTRRAPSSALPPDVLLEFSTDGETFAPFPMVTYSTASNTQGIREITVENTDVWIRATTTNQADVGKSFSLSLIKRLR